jgi:hypothetical protein
MRVENILVERDPVGNDRTFQFDTAGVFKTRLTDAIGATRFDMDRAIAQPKRITYADGTSAQFSLRRAGPCAFQSPSWRPIPTGRRVRMNMMTP